MRVFRPLRTSLLAVPLAILAFAAVSGPSFRSRAAEDPGAAEAKRHYEEGTKAYNLGEYPRAIAEFRATYNAKPDPLLLYNIAQSYRLAGDAPQALFFYKSFLRNMPAASNRREVEGRIKTLEKQVADQKKEGGPGPAPVVVPALPPSPSAETPAPATAPATTAPPGRAPESPASTHPAAAAPATTSPPPSEPAPATANLAPSNAGSATATEPGLNLTAPALPPEEHSPPFYKKWWFWAGTAAVLIIVGGVVAASAKKAPKTTLGTYDPTFN